MHTVQLGKYSTSRFGGYGKEFVISCKSLMIMQVNVEVLVQLTVVPFVEIIHIMLMILLTWCQVLVTISQSSSMLVTFFFLNVS